MLTDIEIARECTMKPIAEIASDIGIQEDELEMYGKYKAKLSWKLLDRIQNNKSGKLILVTAINPTPAGEGKTTTTVGLGQAIARMGKKSIIALREPSLGPVMGIKGGAAGGGYSQVVPMEDINLHFTGDIHAVSSATNLLSALIDNHLYHGNSLSLDPRQIIWKRSLDMNDRALRDIVIGLGGKSSGIPREDGFNITAASEIMAILTLASDLQDLRDRIGRIIVGYSYTNEAVTVSQLKAEGSLTMLLKDAIKPNLVQTLENTPALIHGGPFANIAHGCSSLIATKTALKLSDYVITEAGFGADLGAEKFFNIKCRIGGLIPDAAILVATVRALKLHGGCRMEDISSKDLSALDKGYSNLQKHMENLRHFGVPFVIAINRFITDTDEEISMLGKKIAQDGAIFSISEVYTKGGEGAMDLAEKITGLIETTPSLFDFLYPNEMPVKKKIETIAKNIYGAARVEYSKQAEFSIRRLEALGLGKHPVCMAKTQYSLSDQPKSFGRPENFSITVQEVIPSAGAGFLVVKTGEIMTMPGLPAIPAAQNMDIDKEGNISGLF